MSAPIEPNINRSCHHIVPLTVVAGGEVSAALTLSGLRVAVLAVAVTLARSALREAPESWEAVGALPTCCPCYALTLAGCFMTEGRRRTLRVTVALCRTNKTLTKKSVTEDNRAASAAVTLTFAARGAELVRRRCTVVAVSADNVGPTPALTSAGITHSAERTLRVTLACCEKKTHIMSF